MLLLRATPRSAVSLGSRHAHCRVIPDPPFLSARAHPEARKRYVHDAMPARHVRTSRYIIFYSSARAFPTQRHGGRAGVSPVV